MRPLTTSTVTPTAVTAAVFALLLVFVIDLSSHAVTIEQALRNHNSESKQQFQWDCDCDVLAFGDSLTKGSYNTQLPNRPSGPNGWAKSVHPYSVRLGALLGPQVRVFQTGIGGERTDSMLIRLPTILQNDTYSGVRLAVILGGTNDLSQSFHGESILDNLMKLHEAIYAHGDSRNKTSYTVVVTIPQATWVFDRANHLMVNEGLRRFAALHSDRSVLVDLYNEFTLSGNASLWCVDGGHFTPDGYDKFGELVYRALTTVQLASRDNTAAALVDRIKRRNGSFLAFGDSLTAGLHVDQDGTHAWQDAHPYGLRLNQLLQHQSIDNNNSTSDSNAKPVIVAGIHGEETDKMLKRLSVALKNHRSSVHAVAILGGTNDLSPRGPLSRIMPATGILTNLVKMHELCHQLGKTIGRPIVTIVITIPDCEWISRNASTAASRLVVNDGLRVFVKTHLENSILVDLTDLSSNNGNNDTTQQLWSTDRCHLSPLGYDVVAKRIFDVLVRYPAPSQFA